MKRAFTEEEAKAVKQELEDSGLGHLEVILLEDGGLTVVGEVEDAIEIVLARHILLNHVHIARLRSFTLDPFEEVSVN